MTEGRDKGLLLEFKKQKRRKWFFFFFFWQYSLHVCAGLFSSCGEQGLLSSSGQASPCAGFSLQSGGSRVQGLSYSAVCGIFPNQELNPGPLTMTGEFFFD